MINKCTIEMVQKETIECERPPIREGLEKIVKVERKRINVALRVVSAFRNSDPNNNSSPQTTISSSFMGVSTFAYISNPC